MITNIIVFQMVVRKTKSNPKGDLFIYTDDENENYKTVRLYYPEDELGR